MLTSFIPFYDGMHVGIVIADNFQEVHGWLYSRQLLLGGGGGYFHGQRLVHENCENVTPQNGLL